MTVSRQEGWGPATSRAGQVPVDLVGVSVAIAAIRDTAATIATRQCTLMVLGDTGTGKEILARYIHQLSPRSCKPFIPVDCSALTETLFESQVFGHARGAFTGAIRDSLGFVRAAHGGTLFLDEVGELPLPLQAKLLRILQERAVVPVGESNPRPVDVRVITATHRDLPEMVRKGSFRQDLFYRLNVVVLQMPPLRERPADILPLARHFLSIHARTYEESPKRLSPAAQSVLRAHSWPGNVRELANAIEHAHTFCAGEIVECKDLPPHLRAGPGAALGGELHLETVERQTIAEAMLRTRHCKAAASRLLGIDVKRLSRRLARLGIREPGTEFAAPGHRPTPPKNS